VLTNTLDRNAIARIRFSEALFGVWNRAALLTF
jgi:hypothetical protein